MCGAQIEVIRSLFDSQVVCTEGPDRIRELIAMGASFDHGEDGNLHLAREGGHSHRRIVHAADMTGREIERALLEAVKNDPNISVFEHQFAVDLLTSEVLSCSCSLAPFFHRIRVFALLFLL